MADESGPLALGQPVHAAVVCIAAAGVAARPARSSALTRALLERDLRQFRALTRGTTPLSIAESYDGLVLAFGSVREAVRFAIRVQEAVHDNVRKFPPEQRLEHKLGVHVGDVEIKPEGAHGETVTVALRLMSEAPPGTIWISQAAYELVRRKPGATSRYLGLQRLADVPDPIPAYALTVEPPQTTLRAWLRRNWRVVAASAGVLAFAGCNLALLTIAFRLETAGEDMPVTLVVAATPLPLAGGPGPLAAPTPGGGAVPIPMPVVQPTPVPPTTLIGLQTFEDTPGHHPPAEPFRMPTLPGVSVRVSDQHSSPFSRGSHALLIERDGRTTLGSDAIATELSWPRDDTPVVARLDVLVPGDLGPDLPALVVFDSQDQRVIALRFNDAKLSAAHAGGSAVLSDLPPNTWHRVELQPERRDGQAYLIVELTRWDAERQTASGNERIVVPLASAEVPLLDRLAFGWVTIAPATQPTTQPASQPATSPATAPGTQPAAELPTTQPVPTTWATPPATSPAAAPAFQPPTDQPATSGVATQGSPSTTQVGVTQPGDTQPTTAAATQPVPTDTPSATPTSTATPVPPRNAVLIIDNLEVRRVQ